MVCLDFPESLVLMDCRATKATQGTEDLMGHLAKRETKDYLEEMVCLDLRVNSVYR